MMKMIFFPILICILVHTSAYGLMLPSPLGQYKSGILAQDVHCNGNFILVIKLHDGSPSCIKPTSMRLLKQDWILVQYNNTSSKGLLTGYVTYYPCHPVERLTDPPCTGNAHNFTVNVYFLDNKTIAGKTISGMDGIYQMELKPGTYNIVTQSRMMFSDESKADLVKINMNKTTVFNITLDSGIR